MTEEEKKKACEKVGGSKPANLIGSGVDCVEAKSGVAANAPGDVVQTVAGILIWVIGVASIFMIVFGGIKIGTSAGDAGKVRSGKNMIMYAVIGLVVALLAWAIVDFVVENVMGGSPVAQ
jgi:hypothetical protein